MPEYQYNHIYDCITIPYKLEKYMFYQNLLAVSALIYNLVILPVRVLTNLIRLLFQFLRWQRITWSVRC